MATATVSRPPLMDEVATAERIGVEPQTLRNWRCTKKVALPYVKIGRTVRYDPAAVEKFLAKCAVTPAKIETD